MWILSVECWGKKKPTSYFFVAIYYYEYKTSKRSSMKFKEKEVGQMVTSYNKLHPTILWALVNMEGLSSLEKQQSHLGWRIGRTGDKLYPSENDRNC